MDVAKVSSEQEWVLARHSRMVGRVLDQVEAALPEGNQCEKLKKLIQMPLYDFRNEILKYLDGQIDPNSNLDI
jgi:hypothetical protein